MIGAAVLGPILICGVLSLFFWTDYGYAEQLLRIAVAQMGVSPNVHENCRVMLEHIREAVDARARVIVFPEGALCDLVGEDARREACRERLANAARENNVFLIFGEAFRPTGSQQQIQMAKVLDPNGREIFRYVKHYGDPKAPLPGTFSIDGHTASLIICADRWLRTIEEIPIQLGAQLSFELSANFAEEWVPELEWYWYVARAMRNNVWVIFANSANNPDVAGHGHSAIIDPAGNVVAAFSDNREGILICDIDPAMATRAEALRRAGHPGLKTFWKTGRDMVLEGRTPQDVALVPATFEMGGEVCLAAAEKPPNLISLEEMVTYAAGRGADLIAFPARAFPREWLPVLKELARKHSMWIAGGFIPEGERSFNTAVIVDDQGRIIAQYSQLSARAPFRPGDDPRAMVFKFKHITAMITLEDDLLWTELFELAAVAGVQIVIHLDHTLGKSQEHLLRRRQLRVVASSFGMFCVVADVTRPCILEDLNARAERHAVINRLNSRPCETVLVCSPFSANVVAEGIDQEVVVGRCTLPETQPYFVDRVRRYPALARWLKWGSKEVFRLSD